MSPCGYFINKQSSVLSISHGTFKIMVPFKYDDGIHKGQEKGGWGEENFYDRAV